MARAKNAACPKCGSEEIRKERMFGVQTGDLICSDCKYTSTRNEFVEAFIQKHPENDD
ncbi:Eag protein [Vibrio anguillarum]|nr:Eag protein [Vibrio anguillarum]NNN97700.1 Eag protein [Vibrio sp. B4-6]